MAGCVNFGVLGVHKLGVALRGTGGRQGRKELVLAGLPLIQDLARLLIWGLGLMLESGFFLLFFVVGVEELLLHELDGLLDAR